MTSEVFSSGWFPDMRDEVEKTDLAKYKSSGKRFRLFWVGVARRILQRKIPRPQWGC